MKREAFIIAVAISLISVSGAVVNENGSSPSKDADDGEMAITSAPGSSASASTAVGPNGTEWRSEFSMTGAQCLSGNSTGVTNSSFETGEETYSVSLQGTVETANPCHTLEHEVVETDTGHYTLNITSNAENGTCTQCIGAVSYEASFESDEPFYLKVVHDGEEVEELIHPETTSKEPSDRETEEKGFFGGLFRWLGNLF